MKAALRRMSLVGAILAAVLAGVPVAAPAAAVIVNLEFDVDGVLPSAEPDIGLHNNTGNAESALYSVSGGLLQQRTYSVNGNASYGYPNASVSGGGITPADSFSMEARLRIADIEGLGGAFFQAFDGANRYSVFFSPGAVQVLTLSGFDAFAVDLAEFHTYRLETGANSNAFDFYIDDALVHSDLAISYSTFNGTNFGDGITDPGTGADVDWDYIRFSQPAAEVAVTEPAAALLVLPALAALLGARRRAFRSGCR